MWHKLELSYSTVREYNRFIDVFPEITHFNGDLKNFQRPWVVDAVTRLLPNKGRVLEMGADRCELADFLYKKGFEVWVIDVYDKFGGGVGSYKEICKKFRKLKIHQGFLHEDTSLPSGVFDAVYSCSVIEHIPSSSITSTVNRIGDLLRPGGLSIHAIDFTVAGIMQNHELLESFTSAHGIPEKLESLGRFAQDDLDTFYLSPQGHYSWRKFLNKTYEEYSYRRVTSLNLVAAKNS